MVLTQAGTAATNRRLQPVASISWKLRNKMPFKKSPLLRLNKIVSVALASCYLFSFAARAAHAIEVNPDNISTFKITRPLSIPASKIFADHFLACNTHFILDSGASCHALDKRFELLLNKIHDEINIKTAGNNSVRSPLFSLASVDTHEIYIGRNAAVAVLDFEKASRAAGLEISGVVGMPAFLRHTVILNFDDGVMHIRRASDHPSSYPGEVMPLRILGGNRFIAIENVSIAGNDGSLLLDTGSDASVTVTKSNFDALHKHGLISSVHTMQVTTADGQAKRRCGILQSIKVGPFKHEAIAVSESSANAIGLGYLRRFNVAIDASNRKIYLDKSRSHYDFDYIDTSGLHLRWVKGRVIASSVDSLSPAHIAGILAGDILVKIGDKRAEESSLFEMRQLLRSKPGRIVSATLQRQDQEYSTSFQLIAPDDRNPKARKPLLRFPNMRSLSK